MGQTLTHGIYLPDEGERNCYNGLAGNWRLLDGAIGTVAAHTTAIAGKADISHFHGNITNDGKVGTTANKPLITGTGGVVQAGSFGNQANTFCEGNDSRLSDARTPVAHTHTKSDVTDLLNSNFIPSANNSYDLGSSSYQWNNLYAKNYYYNGVAWGLDKDNVWNGSNRFTKSISLGSITSYTDCSLGFTGLYNTLFFNTRGSSNIPSYGTYVCYGYSNASSDRGAIIRMIRTTDKRGETNDGYIPDTSFNLYKISPEKLFIDFMEAVRVTNDGTENSLKPITNNTTDLGTSTNKWKTLNGINPGALSLPDYDSTAKLNITSTFPTPDSNNIISFTPTMSGWLYVYFNVANATTSANYFYAEIKDNNMNNANAAQVFWRLKPAQDLPVFFPVIANKVFRIEINFTGYTLVKALIIPGMGHVA